MGAIHSRLFGGTVADTTRPTGDALTSTGTIYGPSFVLERDEIHSTGLSSRAFMQDIVNLLSTGTGTLDLQAVRNLGDIYSHLPPAETTIAKTIKSSINLQRGSLNISRVKQEPKYQLGFKFDSTVPVIIKLYWNVNCAIIRETGKLRSKFTNPRDGIEETNPQKFGPFPSSLNQSFELPYDQLLTKGLLESRNLHWITELNLDHGVQIINSPVIAAKALDGQIDQNNSTVLPPQPPAMTEGNVFDLVIELCSQDSVSHYQATLIKFGTSADHRASIEFLKKITIIDNQLYTLQEVYGLTSDSPTDHADATTQDASCKERFNVDKECVVCMSEAKDTMVLPCRHVCLCKECAGTLREQGRPANGLMTGNSRPKCPICRQVFHSLVCLEMPSGYGQRDSVASRKRSMLNISKNGSIAESRAEIKTTREMETE